MTRRSEQVCPIRPLSKDTFQRRLAAAWGRVWPAVGKGKMADAMLSTTKTIDRAVTAENLPEAHTIFNSLAADPSALDEILSAYGFRLCRDVSIAANDLNTAAGVIAAMGELVHAMADGRRDHNETLAVATLLRPWMPALTAIMREAEDLRGVA